MKTDVALTFHQPEPYSLDMPHVLEHYYYGEGPKKLVQ